jgi:hypothetical protein
MNKAILNTGDGGKNLPQLHSLFVLANLVIAGRMLRNDQMS